MDAKIKYLFWMLLGIFIFVLFNISAWEDDTTANQAVNGCGALITENAIYNLTQNISSAGTCFNITAHNVTLDCQGYEINYSSGGAVGGNAVNVSKSNYTTIKNCIIKEGMATLNSKSGIYLYYSNNATIYNNSIRLTGSTVNAILLNRGCSSNNLTQNLINTFGTYSPGITLVSLSTLNWIYNNTINTYGASSGGDGSHGVFLTNSQYNNITANVLNMNNTYATGIYLYSSSTNNTVYNNNIRKNTSDSNSYGIYILTNADSNFILNNSVYSPTDGIFSSSSSFNVLTYNNVNTPNLTSYVIYGTTINHYNHTIDETNLAEGKAVNYTFNGQNFNVSNNYSFGQVICGWCTNVTYDNLSVSAADPISLFYTSNSTISNNIINTSLGRGIYLYQTSNNNRIFGNFINTSGAWGYGILAFTSSSNNSIYNNIINTTGPHGYGIYLMTNCYNNSIYNNSVVTSKSFDGSGAHGIYLYSTCNNNKIFNNSVKSFASSTAGVFIRSSDYNAVDKNNLTALNSYSYGVDFYEGSDYNNMTNNFINLSNSAYSYGIYMSSTITNNLIYNNIIHTAGGSWTSYGVSLYTSANQNNITNNQITNFGGEYGIGLSYGCNHNIFYNNSINNKANSYSGNLYFFQSSTNNSFSSMTLIKNGSLGSAIHLADTNHNFTMTNIIINMTNSSVPELNISGSVKGGTWNFTNVTRVDGFSSMNITWVAGGNGTLNMHWYADFYTNYSNSSIAPGYNISTWDVNNNLINSTATNDSGNARITLLEYENRNNTLKTFYTNYSFNASTWYYPVRKSVNISTNKQVVLTIDVTNPNASLLTPANNTYNNASAINLTTNLSDDFSGIKNATLWVYNESGLYNATDVVTYVQETITSALGVVITFVDGVYKWFWSLFDFAGNQFSTLENNTLTVDLTKPLINFTYPTLSNGSYHSQIEINVSITETNFANLTFIWNGSAVYYNASNLTSLGSGNYTFNTSYANLVPRAVYYYNLTVWDLAGNSNSSETRWVTGNSAFNSSDLQNSPSVNIYIDPDANILITANITKQEYNLDTIILQWKNSTAVWGNATNVTMINQTVKSTSLNQASIYTFFNASFALPSYEDNISYRIWANDTAGASNYSSIYNLTSYWDCTWTINPTLIGSVSGWNINKWIANLSLNNTGDIAYSNGNCTLNYRVTYDLTEGRVYIDQSKYKNKQYLGIAPGINRTIEINASFLTEVVQESLTITFNEINSRSNQTNFTSIATLISNQQGPYLYQAITESPTVIYLTAGNFTLNGYIRNVMGSLDANASNTAYNVTFNWTLPSVFTNASAKQLNFSNLSDSDLHYNSVNVTFANLATMSAGTQKFYLYGSGLNLSDGAIVNALNETLVTNTVNISFLCYSILDGVCVTNCSYLQDPDCDEETVTTTTTITSSSGSGGGGSATTAVFRSDAIYYLIAGRQERFELKLENPYTNPRENIKVKVSGLNSKYIQIEPDTLSRINGNSIEEVGVIITAPSYFTQGTYNLIFEITGTIINGVNREAFTERKYVTLYIIEVSNEEADKYLNQSILIVGYMEKEGFNIKSVKDLLEDLKTKYSEVDFISVKKDYQQIKQIFEAAEESKSLLEELEEKLGEAEANGVDVLEAKKMFYMAQTAFERGDFILSLERIKAAKLTYALEVKGEFNLFYSIRNHPVQSYFILLILGVIGTTGSFVIRLEFYKRKYKLLQGEEKLLLELMKVVQRECFENNHMSMEEYREAMAQYEKRLSFVIQEKIRVETELANFSRLRGRKPALNEEKKRLIHLIQELQEDYLNKGKIETRVYENMIKSYGIRLGEVEGQISTLEAEKALEEKKWYSRIKMKLGWY